MSQGTEMPTSDPCYLPALKSLRRTHEHRTYRPGLLGFLKERDLCLKHKCSQSCWSSRMDISCLGCFPLSHSHERVWGARRPGPRRARGIGTGLCPGGFSSQATSPASGTSVSSQRGFRGSPPLAHIIRARPWSPTAAPSQAQSGGPPSPWRPHKPTGSCAEVPASQGGAI